MAHARLSAQHSESVRKVARDRRRSAAPLGRSALTSAAERNAHERERVDAMCNATTCHFSRSSTLSLLAVGAAPSTGSSHSQEQAVVAASATIGVLEGGEAPLPPPPRRRRRPSLAPALCEPNPRVVAATRLASTVSSRPRAATSGVRSTTGASSRRGAASLAPFLSRSSRRTTGARPFPLRASARRRPDLRRPRGASAGRTSPERRSDRFKLALRRNPRRRLLAPASARRHSRENCRRPRAAQRMPTADAPSPTPSFRPCAITPSCAPATDGEPRSFRRIDDRVEAAIRMMATPPSATRPVNRDGPDERAIDETAEPAAGLTGSRSKLVSRSPPANNSKP